MVSHKDFGNNLVPYLWKKSRFSTKSDPRDFKSAGLPKGYLKIQNQMALVVWPKRFKNDFIKTSALL